jgi:hypothetical protein
MHFEFGKKIDKMRDIIGKNPNPKELYQNC